MNSMRVYGIKRNGSSRLEYSYTVECEWSRFFEPDKLMWVEYSRPVDSVPDSVAVIPLIGNVIVLASIVDADIYVDELDRDFYESIPEFINGFEEIMPDHVHFKHGEIVHADKLIDNPLSDTEHEENLLFFSGGVDANFSLLTHLAERPALVTVWGADIPWDNKTNWENALKFNHEVAEKNGLDMLIIHSNFRKALNNDNLEEFSMELVNDWWWSAFHHSVAMMCLAAPLALNRASRLYFGSTHSAKDLKEWGSYVLASDPKIDNKVRFCGCQVVHDGYEFSRYDKIKHICEYYGDKKDKPYLRVCYLSNTGRNCGICEKCASAIMAINIAGGNPADYGFSYDPRELPRYFAAGLQENCRIEKFDALSLYKDVQTAYRNKYSIQEVPPELKAFYMLDLDIIVDFLHVPNNELIARDKAARDHEHHLYDEIGQIKYWSGVKLKESEARAERLARELEAANARKKELNEEKKVLKKQKADLEERLREMYRSNSWKLTRPLRYVKDVLGRRK